MSLFMFFCKRVERNLVAITDRCEVTASDRRKGKVVVEVTEVTHRGRKAG